MIRYKKTWCGADIIFRLAGTSWPSGVLPGAIAAGISICLSYWESVDDRISDRPSFVSHPYAFQLFAYMLGFLMIFRTNFAYARYWEAMGALQAMGAKWLDGACMGIIFDAGGDNAAHLLHGMNDHRSNQPHEKTFAKGGPCHSVFAEDMCHLCSLLHALALLHLRGDTDLNNISRARDSCGEVLMMRGSMDMASETLKHARCHSKKVDLLGMNYDEKYLHEVYKTQRIRVIGGISQSERNALESKVNGKQFSSEARVAMVQSWFMRRLIARQKFEQGESAITSPPILSRLYQVISDGGLWFSAASKIAITPFPFPYHNLIGILLWTYTFCVPFLVNGLIMERSARGVVAFLAVFCYHSLAKVGDNLEDPYTPYDPNELPLQEIQESVNTRLLMFGVVPEDGNGHAANGNQENGVLQPTSPPPVVVGNPAKTGILPCTTDVAI